MGRIGCLLIIVAACGSDKPSDPVVPDLSCEGMPDPHCANPIDRVLIPKLRALGVPIAEASKDELCRRMAIDLLGHAASAAAHATCLTQTPGEMADTFFAHPDYLRTQRRAWSEILQYNTPNIFSEDLVDIDRLVRDVYAETIDYPEFATLLAMHPALEGIHPDDSWTTYVWQTFLGRPARQDEVDSMRPFTNAWTARAVCDGAVWWYFYNDALVRQGKTEAEAVSEGNMACWNVAKVEWGFNGCDCRPGPFNPGCTSDVLGKRVTITGACPNPNNFADPVNTVRASSRTMGPNTCPDGSSRAECNDRLIDYTTQYAFLPFYEWSPPPPAIVTEMRSVGDALIARGDFWETAADREMRRLLDWWQSTFRHPDSDLPEVRKILAAELVRTGSLRALQRTILTSLIYIQPGAAPDIPEVESKPPWIAGPTKLLSGESWLETAAAAVGETITRCDFRWIANGGYAPYYHDQRLIDYSPGTLDALRYPGYSIGSTIRLSGCNTDSKRPEVSNIGLVFNQADIARTLCAYGRGVLPPGFTNNLTEAAGYLVERVWNRAGAPAEVTQMVADMNQCLAAGSTTACANPDAAVRWMCLRMIDSAEFATY